MATDVDSGGGHTRVLADGHRLPMLGLGVWQVPDGPACTDAVRWALEAGYRHLDTAQAYGNEESVGRGLRESRVPRDEVFVTTKFYPARKDPVAEAEGSLRRLGVDYVDLYIIHWPQGGPTWAWPGMQRALELGYTRSIGVSNFGVGDLDQVLKAGHVAPAVDQVQFSPFEYRRRLLVACQQRGIALEAYSPLGTAGTSLHRRSRELPSVSGANQRRSCCAGASNTRFPSSASPPTANGSSRTPRSWTSLSQATTWQNSTLSIPPAGRTRPWKRRGGEATTSADRSYAAVS
jgi:diketogulonate reductase-like aldo/keto reductase